MREPDPELRFCPRCAAHLEWRPVDFPDVLQPVCVECGFVLWQNLKPCVDAIILRGTGANTELLLGRRREDELWDTPGGFLNASDEIEAALIRDCRREMGIDVAVGDLIGIFQDTFEGTPIVSLFYSCRIAAGEPWAAYVIEDVRWFRLSEPPQVKFPGVAQAIAALQHVMGLGREPDEPSSPQAMSC